ncbi:amidohydrolase family protein [Novosphingobium pentaromativorans]|uniref:Amidohydrolase 2 n=1 Tax=Novosphingobium pentaromativorans US6-1 TaxID=1088721 RepID=G6E826_9SPHN|nr:amidohydrolase family protein [Novosphingobium pentaromativorans]EHJ62669.1 amidohydrolase 2 [Novosphingobium pentaromativorans US6-1]
MNALVKPESLQGVHVVDADTHVTEVHDLWTSRASPKFRDRVPQVKQVDGELAWYIDGEYRMGPAMTSCCIRKDGSKSFGFDLVKMTIQDVYEGAFDVKARVAYMDEAGFSAQIAYPNLLGFGNQKSMKVDPELRLVTTQIFNDASAEMQADSGNRVFPMILLPWWDIEASVKEAERCHAMGLRGVNLNSDPQIQGYPVLGDPHWDPLWEACSSLDLPINFHIGGGMENSDWYGQGGWPTDDPNLKMAFGSSQMPLTNYRVLSNIILSRFLEKWPKLNIVSVESGVTWIPFMLESLEYQMQDQGIEYELSPLEIFRRQIYACFWYDQVLLPEAARHLGTDHLLFETDFPHPTCAYPNALERIERSAAGFTPDERAKVFGDNAINLYNLPTEGFESMRRAA